MRQPQEAIRMIAEKLNHAFENRDLCKARPKEEDILARFIPLMQILGMDPQILTSSPVTGLDYLYWMAPEAPGVDKVVLTVDQFLSPEDTWRLFDAQIAAAKVRNSPNPFSFEEIPKVLDIKPMLGQTFVDAYDLQPPHESNPDAFGTGYILGSLVSGPLYSTSARTQYNPFLKIRLLRPSNPTLSRPWLG